MERESNIVGVRELHSRLREISEATMLGESFIIVRNTKPIFRIEPYKKEGKKYSLADFSKIRFRGGKNLSKNIDKIIYGK